MSECHFTIRHFAIIEKCGQWVGKEIHEVYLKRIDSGSQLPGLMRTIQNQRSRARLNNKKTALEEGSASCPAQPRRR
jgi:hypothetical protein